MLPLIIRRLYFSALTAVCDISIAQMVIFLIQIMLVLYFLFAVPFPLRHALAAGALPQTTPLEFTFRTCHDELHGVCSFLEAQLVVESGTLTLQPNWAYDVALELRMYDTPQNRQLGMFIAGVESRAADDRPLVRLRKSVSILRSTFDGHEAESFGGYLATAFSSVYTLTRNFVFLPLYLAGFFSSTEAADTRRVDVAFPRPFVESGDVENATHLIHVQLQTKFIQLAAASLRVEARVGALRRFVAQWPMVAHLMINFAIFVVFTFVFVVYWAWRSYELYETLRR